MVDAAVEESYKAGMGGLEFLAGMPGSIGGAVWMNARCYGSEVADVLEEVSFLDEGLELRTLTLNPFQEEGGPTVEGFGYKRSPFQGKPWIILRATFRMTPQDPELLQAKILQYRMDREQKGHFLAPSAGSVFKNDRSFGAPAGVILDRLGFKGVRIGGAEVSPLHANIILNRGSARAVDIRRLVHRMQEAVQNAYGRALEPEILFIGRWESWAEKNRVPPT